PPAAARLRGDAGDDFARHQGPRSGEAVRRRRLSAARRRSPQPRDGAHRPRARGGGIPPQRRTRPAARRRPHRPRPGAGAGGGARSRAARRGRRHDCRRRHDPPRRARRAGRGLARQTAEGLRRRMTHRTDGVERVVLAQAGGLDTSIAIPWLADTYRAEIIAVTIDLGQRKEWLEEVRDRALATGALRAHVVDVRDEFARDYLVRGLKAGLFSDDPAAMTEALARPIIAQTLVSIAGIEEARAVAHGDRGGSGGAALGKAVRALDPALTVLAVPAS